VARNLAEPTRYAPSYHLNFVDVPKDVVVSHHGRGHRVTLEVKEGKVLLTDLK